MVSYVHEDKCGVEMCVISLIEVYRSNLESRDISDLSVVVI
jgi:hypothetical protein